MTTMLIIISVIAVAVLLCFLLAVANFSGERFLERFEQMNKIEIKGETSPVDFVSQMNEKYFEGSLKFVKIDGVATDAYSKGRLLLSEKTLSLNTIASYTIIAHELGHALQDKSGKKLKRLVVLRKIGRFLGLLFTPLLVGAGVLLVLGIVKWAIAFVALSALIFLLALLVKLRTISIEKDASKKAIVFLKDYLTDNEMKMAKRFLKDAKLTYWADFLRILLWWTAMSRKSKLFN